MFCFLQSLPVECQDGQQEDLHGEREEARSCREMLTLSTSHLVIASDTQLHDTVVVHIQYYVPQQ